VRMEVTHAAGQVSSRSTSPGEPQSLLSLDPALVELVDRSPVEAILRALDIMSGDLRRRLTADGYDGDDLETLTATQLATCAASRAVISEPSAEAVRALDVLRTLAARGGGHITPAQALDFLALTDRVLYTFRGFSQTS
jgi:hypothetical protein